MSGRRLVTGPTPHEVDTVAALEAVLDRHEPLHGLRLQDLDLTAVAPRLLRRDDLRGLVVLGGVVPDELAGHLKRHGAMVFPSDPHAPLEVYRPHLYTPDELYAGLEQGYESTLDAVAYGWATDERARHDAYVTLLRAIHDHSVTDALDEALEGRRVAGVMGGHAVARGEATYADAAHLGRRLAGAGLTVVTGGGPGAMEAANLGALLATGADALEKALARLAAVPSFRPSVTDWARLALEVRAELAPPSAEATPASVRSIGIPTWFYGHEPPNVFCDGIGKYFSNALREDGLLARSTEGIVVLPGAAGTVQEIFQAITPLYYAPDGAALPRLVLVGSAHWTGEVPLWSAVEALGVGRRMSGRVHLVDDVTEAADILIG